MFKFLFPKKAIKNKLKEIESDYQKSCQNKYFDLSFLDNQITKLADEIYDTNSAKFTKNTAIDKSKIGIMASELYDYGGHTECLRNFVNSFYNEYTLQLFLSRVDQTLQNTPEKFSDISKKIKFDGVNYQIHKKDFADDLINLYNKIIAFAPKLIFLYIHMDDFLSAAVCHLIRKHSDIKILFFNHGDHIPSVGLKSVNLIIDCRKCGQYLTNKFRKKSNSTIIPLQSKKEQDTIYFSTEQKKIKRQELGIGENEYMSLSGFNADKIFSGKNYEYLFFIKKLLLSEPKLKHILASNLSNEQKKIIDSVFENDLEAKKRFILTPRVANFDLIFQSCDVFIDSFPIGSALTHIDMIRNKRPTIIKQNLENELFSFQSYLYPNYEYAFSDLDKMLQGTLFLIHNQEEQNRIIEKSYQHYLDQYEFESVKAKYLKIIEGADNIEQFYDKIDQSLYYNLGDIR